MLSSSPDGWILALLEPPAHSPTNCQRCVRAREADGQQVAAWVHDMVAAGHDSFYKLEGSKQTYYDIDSKSYKVGYLLYEFSLFIFIGYVCSRMNFSFMNEMI